MSAHTPGPWTWFSHLPDRQTNEGMKFFVGADEQGFAHTVGLGGDVDIANARLIAAAPELLALLIESQTSIGGDWRDRRDALIAKATS